MISEAEIGKVLTVFISGRGITANLSSVTDDSIVLEYPMVIGLARTQTGQTVANIMPIDPTREQKDITVLKSHIEAWSVAGRGTSGMHEEFALSCKEIATGLTLGGAPSAFNPNLR